MLEINEKDNITINRKILEVLGISAAILYAKIVERVEKNDKYLWSSFFKKELSKVMGLKSREIEKAIRQLEQNNLIEVKEIGNKIIFITKEYV